MNWGFNAAHYVPDKILVSEPSLHMDFEDSNSDWQGHGEKSVVFSRNDLFPIRFYNTFTHLPGGFLDNRIPGRTGNRFELPGFIMGILQPIFCAGNICAEQRSCQWTRSCKSAFWI